MGLPSALTGSPHGKKLAAYQQPSKSVWTSAAAHKHWGLHFITWFPVSTHLIPFVFLHFTRGLRLRCAAAACCWLLLPQLLHELLCVAAAFAAPHELRPCLPDPGCCAAEVCLCEVHAFEILLIVKITPEKNVTTDLHEQQQTNVGFGFWFEVLGLLSLSVTSVNGGHCLCFIAVYVALACCIQKASSCLLHKC
jgi:hypothetical protein